MAWKRYGRRRRPGTQWLASPRTLSRASQEAPVQAYALRNLVVTGTPTGTLAALPQDLMAYLDDQTGAAAEHLNEGSVESRSFLRLVGMLRPLAIGLGDGQGPTRWTTGAEVRYAVYRGTTDEDEADYEESAGPVNLPFADQPDLWLSSHLSNERIAFIRSYMLPTRNSAAPGTLEEVIRMDDTLVNSLPWWFDAALSVIDLRSKRKVSTDSKLYLLRQVRVIDAQPIGAEETYQTCSLYCADYARLLARKVRA